VDARHTESIEWDEVKGYFEHAIELDAEGREGYVRSIRPDNPAVRAELEELLRAHEQVSGPLATNPGAIGHGGAVLEPSDVLAGRFEIIRVLGKGGMGMVYEAYDRGLGERVALKTIRPELLFDSGIRDRFRYEILNARRVSHPNVCRVHDLVVSSEEDGAPLAFTMELLSGETLAERLERDEKLTPEEALPLARQMADGLSELHHRNIVHRDFKPGNIFLAAAEGGAGAPCVKITDFGLARRQIEGANALDSISRPTDLIGTPAYMAPEQLEGDRDKIGPATDVYALGLVLYEMVSGLRPFPAQSLAGNLAQKKGEPPKPPGELVEDLPKSWSDAILRCLQPDPADRPQTPAQALAALEGLADLPTLRIVRKKRVRRALQIAAAAALAIILALFIARVRLQVAEPQKSVAVLPFDTVGGDEELKEVAMVLNGAITRRLSRFEGVNENLVVMASSAVSEQGVTNWSEAARKLGVNFVVEGDLEARGDQLTLVMTLIDVGEGRQVTTQTARGSRDSLSTMLAEAETKLANALALRTQPDKSVDNFGLGGGALGAEEFYDTGVGYLERSFDTGSIEKAIQQFQKTLTIDPDHAAALAGTAEAYWRLHVRDAREGALTAAWKSARRALELAPRLPQAHISLGHLNLSTGHPEEAIKSYRTALALSPRDGDALQGLAEAYGEQEGGFDEARRTYELAVRLRSGDWKAHHQFAYFLYEKGRYEEASEHWRRVTELTPDNARGFTNLGAALHLSGRIDEARQAYQTAIEIEPVPTALANLGKMYYDAGEYRRALDLFQRAVAADPHSYKRRQNLAAAYDVLGDPRASEAYLGAAKAAEGALDVNPRLEDLYSRLAFYYAGAGDAKAAESWLVKALARAPDDSMEAARNAATLAKLGRVREVCGWLAVARNMGHRQEQLEEFRWLKPQLAEPGCAAFLKAA
jgi:serine/threonine-protein kinase